jgi:hypothetical protein
MNRSDSREVFFERFKQKQQNQGEIKICIHKH